MAMTMKLCGQDVRIMNKQFFWSKVVIKMKENNSRVKLWEVFRRFNLKTTKVILKVLEKIKVLFSFTMMKSLENAHRKTINQLFFLAQKIQ